MVDAARRDDGSILPMTMVLLGGLAVVILVFVSAQEGWAARRDAQWVANAAARAGAQVDPLEWRQSQQVSAGAKARAQAVMASHGASGSVSVGAREITVVVSMPVTHTFAVSGVPTQTSASATVELVRGVDGSEE